MPFFGLFKKPDIVKLKAENDVKGLIKALRYRRDPNIQIMAARALGEISSKIEESLLEIAVEPLISALKEKEPRVRAEAAHLLGYGYSIFVDVRAVVPLCTLLEDESEYVRENAAHTLDLFFRVLKDIKDTEDGYVVRSLLAALQDGSDGVRAHVVSALGKMGGPKVTGSLVPMLKDKSADVRRATAFALEDIGGSRVIAPLIEIFKSNARGLANAFDGEIGAVALDALIDAMQNAKDEIGVAAIDTLIDAMQNAKDEIRVGAILAVGYILAMGYIKNERVVEPLIAALHDTSVDVRDAAVTVFQNNAETQDVLIAALQDKDDEVRRNTVLGLGNIKNEPAIKALIAALQDKDDEVRRNAVVGLGKVKDQLAVKALIAALQDKDDEVRRNAVVGLGNIENGPAIKALIVALQDKDDEVRRNAVVGLGKVKDEKLIEPLIAVLQDNDGEVRKNALQALEAYDIKKLADSIVENKDTRAVALFRHALHHYEDEEVRLKAVWVLTQLGDVHAAEALITVLGDMDEPVSQAAKDGLLLLGSRAVEPLIAALKRIMNRFEIVELLEQIGDIRAVEPLITILEDKEKFVRVKAVRALGKFGDTRAVEPLLAMFNVEHFGHINGEDIATALGEIWGDQTVESLIATLNNVSSKVRCGVTLILGPIGDTRAVEPLITTLTDKDGNVRAAAITSLGQIGDTRAVEPIITTLTDNDGKVRAAAINSLGRIGDSRAVEPLVAMLKDEDSRFSAARVLEKMGDLRGIEALHTYLQASDSGFSAFVACLLAESGDEKGLLTFFPLLIADLKQGSGRWAHPDLARRLLEQFSSKLEKEDLKEICELQDYSIKERVAGDLFDITTGAIDYEFSKPIDLSNLRQLARQELIRRGEEA